MTDKSDENQDDEHWVLTLYQRYRELYGDPETQAKGKKASWKPASRRYWTTKHSRQKPRQETLN